jgi:hypothetical protein
VKRALASAGLLALLAAGCGDGGESAPPLPPITATPSATVSATPTPTFAETLIGATEFVRSFYASLSEAYAAGDPDLIRQMVDPSCETCANYLSSLEQIRDRKLSVVGGEFSVLSAEAPGPEGGLTVVSSRLDYRGVKISETGGDVVLDEEPAKQLVELGLARVGDGWTIKHIELVGPAEE